MKTEFENIQDADRKWWVVDLEGQTLGRAASRIASVLRGKTKVTFTPHANNGDFVVVVNADKVKLTGKKWTDKIYWRHTGFFGGIKAASAEQVRAKHPERLIMKAVWGMLPQGPLGRRMLKKLKVYASAEHPHTAQKPEPLQF